jgi:SAM-dependent methyltransferase
MRREHLPRLTCSGASGFRDAQLRVFRSDRDHVMEGLIEGEAVGQPIPIVDGVPCFVEAASCTRIADFLRRRDVAACIGVGGAGTTDRADGQARTNLTFSDKWRRFPKFGFKPSEAEFLLDRSCRKLGVADIPALQSFYRHRRNVLEVGPGSGFNTRFMAESCLGHVCALDISDAAVTTFENTRDLANCTVVQADLMQAPFPDASFDLIIADGVLHHTPDTRAALAALYRKLAPGGQLFFYIYRQMGAARRFVDEHLRRELSRLTPDDCYRACEGLTELGRELSRLGAKVTLEKPIPALGIPAGTHDVQRLLYYNFVKCFWNEAFEYETNNMVNFDWYHPHHAWQHTQEEVAGWLAELGIAEYRFNDSNPNGISVLLTRPGAGD